MEAVNNHSDLTLQVVASASALLDRYGAVIHLIKKDGFAIDAQVNMLLEGESLTSMAQSTGIGLMSLPPVLEQLQPDTVITVGDRFETMATAIATAYMNIPLAHTMGGEVSGTIDESIRHAVTKLAHIHFPASQDAKDRIIKLGEIPKNIHLVGCPRIDLIKRILDDQNYRLRDLQNNLFNQGVGMQFNLGEPFILVSQHPVTTEYGDGQKQITETLEAVSKTGMHAIVLWPNADAGSDDIARGIRIWREKGLDKNMHFFKNLPIHVYVKLMQRTACLVGNSSSGVREGAFIGTPAVNIGSRQQQRERGHNIIDAETNADDIYEKIQMQIKHGSYEIDPIYGRGDAGVKIANILASTTVDIQKVINY
ncbi:UDP-N-acetylglucosamine 2-epimerase [Terasakiella sp. SH-1]|uniref:UDP-N-acetylglucosamine 2-epimerase n=1 Tax=Terasakiella sp. SH-1 TaxID=2560057 RepID=UPI001F10FECF|nr:UDP-N-acetylglucosamine 2-epimerase [Terasakiella sp. SH-1]